MLRLKNISLLILALMVNLAVFGQEKNRYCIYDQVAIEKYGEKNFEEALAYIDTAITMCDDLKNDPYAYHIKGFICYELFKSTEVDDPYSPMRAEAFDAFLKSNELDANKEFTDKNTKSLKNICIRIQKNIAQTLDTLQYTEAIKLDKIYHDAVERSGVKLDLKEHDITFNNMIGNIYVELYENDKMGREHYIDSAVAYYNRALAIDTLGFDANKNLGYLYHNLSIDIILNMNPEDDILQMYENQEKSSTLGLKSLPYLKRAHEQQPKNRDVLYGLAGIYFMLQEKEKSDFYQKLYDELTKEQQGNGMSPPNNDN
jgi:tetratricopeptide (TPR) repeat protein